MQARSGLYPFYVLLLGAALATNAGAAPNVQEGQWEYEMKVEMPGQTMKMPPMKYSQCVTQKDLVPHAPRQGQMDCKDVSPKVDGNSVTWTVQCRQGNMTMEGSGRVTYQSDSMQGTMKNSVMTAGKPGYASVTTISGHRVGQCKVQK